MKEVFIQNVYDTLLGMLTEEACVPGVRSAFEEGMPCQEKYDQMLTAYQRLRDRLAVENEDPDVEVIINSLLDISKILGREMFLYGMNFANNKENAPG